MPASENPRGQWKHSRALPLKASRMEWEMAARERRPRSSTRLLLPAAFGPKMQVKGESVTSASSNDLKREMRIRRIMSLHHLVDRG